MKEKILKRKTALLIAAVFVVGCLCGGLIFNSFASEGKNISVESAKQIALEYAGVTAAKATFTKAELKKEEKPSFYQIEFFTNANKYEFHIDAKTGAILMQSSEVADDIDQGYIGVEEAKKIAYKHAGVDAERVRLVLCELNTEDEIQIYEVEFFIGGIEYKYSIHAKSGEIVNWKKTGTNNNQGNQNKNNQGQNKNKNKDKNKNDDDIWDDEEDYGS